MLSNFLSESEVNATVSLRILSLGFGLPSSSISRSYDVLQSLSFECLTPTSVYVSSDGGGEVCAFRFISYQYN